MQTLRLASTLLNLAKIIKCRNWKSFDNEFIWNKLLDILVPLFSQRSGDLVNILICTYFTSELEAVLIIHFLDYIFKQKLESPM